MLLPASLCLVEFVQTCLGSTTTFRSFARIIVLSVSRCAKMLMPYCIRSREWSATALTFMNPGTKLTMNLEGLMGGKRYRVYCGRVRDDQK